MRKISLFWALSLSCFLWTATACTSGSSNLQPAESGGAVTAVFENNADSENPAVQNATGPSGPILEVQNPEHPGDGDGDGEGTEPENPGDSGNSSGVMIAQITANSQMVVQHKPLSLGEDCQPSTVLAEGSTDEAGKVEIWHMSIPQSCTIHFSKKYNPAPFCVISTTREFLVVTQGEDFLAFSKPDLSPMDYGQAVFYHCKFPKSEEE